jgi:nitrile hydratase
MTDHDHSRTFQPDHPEPTSDAARVGLALRELLLEGEHYTVDEEQAVIAAMQGASPENGATIVARAWTDPGYRERLLDNGADAIRELGFDLEPYEFTVMENTENIHNVIVCTLCSCYPRALLGMSPAWYKSKNYRSRVNVDVKVHDSTAELRYMVLPQRPADTDNWSEEQLAALVTRDSLVGTQRELQT